MDRRGCHGRQELQDYGKQQPSARKQKPRATIAGGRMILANVDLLMTCVVSVRSA